MSWVHPDPERLRKLLGDYQQECARQRKAGCPALVCAAVLVLCGLAYLPGQHDNLFQASEALPVFAFIAGLVFTSGAVAAMIWPSRARIRILHELMREDEIDLIPTLIRLRAGPMPRQDRAEVDERLAMLLRRVDEHDGRRLREGGMAAIRTALREAPRWLGARALVPHQVDLADALLRAVVRLGDTSALRLIAALAQPRGTSADHERVRQAAADAAAALRSMVDRAGDRLLRPVEMDAEALLRPAEPVEDEMLLRPAEVQTVEQRHEDQR